MIRKLILSSAVGVACFGQPAGAEDTDLNALITALKEMEQGETQTDGTTVELEPVRPAPVAPANRGNLHEDGVILPSNPAEVLAYLNTFDPIDTRLSTILVDLCRKLLVHADVTAEVVAICKAYLPKEQG